MQRIIWRENLYKGKRKEYVNTQPLGAVKTGEWMGAQCIVEMSKLLGQQLSLAL